MRDWPGDTVDNAEEGSQGQDGDQEPGEDNAHHSQAKQHQGQVLQQHFGLHGETHVNFGEKTYCISDTLCCVRSIYCISVCELSLCVPLTVSFSQKRDKERDCSLQKYYT